MKSISCFWTICIHSILCTNDDDFVIFPRKSKQKWKFYPFACFSADVIEDNTGKAHVRRIKGGTRVRYQMVWSTSCRQDSNGSVRCFWRMQRCSIINCSSHGSFCFIAELCIRWGKPVPDKQETMLLGQSMFSGRQLLRRNNLFDFDCPEETEMWPESSKSNTIRFQLNVSTFILRNTSCFIKFQYRNVHKKRFPV